MRRSSARQVVHLTSLDQRLWSVFFGGDGQPPADAAPSMTATVVVIVTNTGTSTLSRAAGTASTPSRGLLFRSRTASATRSLTR